MRRTWAVLWLTAALLAVLLGVTTGLAQDPAQDLARKGTLRLLVGDTVAATEQVHTIVAALGGQVLEFDSWSERRYDQDQKFATLIVSIPALQFERGLLELRRLGLDVLEQNLSGSDRSQETSDLLSKQRFLESQIDRLHELAAREASASEQLRLQQEQASVQAQLDETVRALNQLYWDTHAVQLTVHLQPFIATPTPTLTSTPEPTRTPQPWDPRSTYDDARSNLELLYYSPMLTGCCLLSSGIFIGMLLVLITRGMGAKGKTRTHR